MYEVVARLVWYVIVIIAGAYFSFLGFGSIFEAQQKDPIAVRDEISRGQHFISGMTMVPTACDELTSQVVPLSTTVYAIDLHTWRDPSVKCPTNETARTFSAVVFAPSYGIRLVVFMDGQLVPYFE